VILLGGVLMLIHVDAIPARTQDSQLGATWDSYVFALCKDQP